MWALLENDIVGIIKNTSSKSLAVKMAKILNMSVFHTKTVHSIPCFFRSFDKSVAWIGCLSYFIDKLIMYP